MGESAREPRTSSSLDLKCQLDGGTTSDHRRRPFLLYSFNAFARERDPRVADKYSLRTFFRISGSRFSIKQPAGLPHPKTKLARDCRRPTPDLSHSTVSPHRRRGCRSFCPTLQMSHGGSGRAACSITNCSLRFQVGQSYESTRRDRPRRWLWRLVRWIDHARKSDTQRARLRQYSRFDCDLRVRMLIDETCNHQAKLPEVILPIRVPERPKAAAGEEPFTPNRPDQRMLYLLASNRSRLELPDRSGTT
jgi:hypothetical protein